LPHVRARPDGGPHFSRVAEYPSGDTACPFVSVGKILVALTKTPFRWTGFPANPHNAINTGKGGGAAWSLAVSDDTMVVGGHFESGSAQAYSILGLLVSLLPRP